MTTKRTVAGAGLYMSASLPATFDQIGYEALSWTQINGISSLGGTLGTEFNEVTVNDLSEGMTTTLKGLYSLGRLEPVLNEDGTDTGQALLETAAGEKNTTYSFKVVNSAGDAFYFTGIVPKFVRDFGGPEDIETATTSIVINSTAITAVAAA